MDLTGYKSPISKLKVGVFDVSMSSITLVFILLFLSLLFSFPFFPCYNFYNGLSHIEVTEFSVHFVILVI